MEITCGIKDWIMATNTPLCLWWNIRFYALLLVSYELFYLITQKEELSIIGSIMIVFSGFIQWNFEFASVMLIGEIIVLLVNKLLRQEKNSYRVVISLLITILSVMYILGGLSLAIAFGLAFIPLIIWIVIKNIESIKENKVNIVLLFVSLFLSVCIYKFIIERMGFAVVNDDNYENEYGTKYLFSYLYNIMLPFKNINNSNIYGSFFSIFPFPMIISLYYIFNNEEHTEFLFPLSIFSTIGTVFCIAGLPLSIVKVLGFTKVSTIDVAVAVNLINLFLLFYMIRNIEKEVFKTKHAMRITILLCCLIAFVNYPSTLGTRLNMSLYIIELASTGFLFLNFEDKKYKKVLLAFLIILTIISGGFVNKLTKREETKPKQLETFAFYNKM